jgi:hypothetical protein
MRSADMACSVRWFLLRLGDCPRISIRRSQWLNAMSSIRSGVSVSSASALFPALPGFGGRAAAVVAAGAWRCCCFLPFHCFRLLNVRVVVAVDELRPRAELQAEICVAEHSRER